MVDPTLLRGGGKREGERGDLLNGFRVFTRFGDSVRINYPDGALSEKSETRENRGGQFVRFFFFFFLFFYFLFFFLPYSFNFTPIVIIIIFVLFPLLSLALYFRGDQRVWVDWESHRVLHLPLQRFPARLPHGLCNMYVCCKVKRTSVTEECPIMMWSVFANVVAS